MVAHAVSHRGTLQSVSLEEARAGDRVLRIRGDVLEAERLVERDRGAHRRDRVEAHRAIAGGGGLGEQRVDEAATHAAAGERRSNEEPLHLADPRAEIPERDAAGDVIGVAREEAGPTAGA